MQDRSDAPLYSFINICMGIYIWHVHAYSMYTCTVSLKFVWRFTYGADLYCLLVLYQYSSVHVVFERLRSASTGQRPVHWSAPYSRDTPVDPTGRFAAVESCCTTAVACMRTLSYGMHMISLNNGTLKYNSTQ